MNHKTIVLTAPKEVMKSFENVDQVVKEVVKTRKFLQLEETAKLGIKLHSSKEVIRAQDRMKRGVEGTSQA